MIVVTYVERCVGLSTNRMQQIIQDLRTESTQVLTDYTREYENHNIARLSDETIRPMTPPALMYSQARQCDQVQDIVVAALKIPQYEFQARFPGLVQVDMDTGMVGATMSKTDYATATTTFMKFGRYLTKLKRTEEYTPQVINEYANSFSSYIKLIKGAKLEIATTPEGIVEIYENGPHSCMSGEAGFVGQLHPVYVYGAGDIGVAYVELEGRITARVLVALEKKEYSVIYGNGALIEPLLEKEGYILGDLSNCKILRIEADDGNGYIMPYIDDQSSVSMFDEDHFVLDSLGDTYCNNTCGTSEDNAICEHCGNSYHPEDDDAVYIDDYGGVCTYSCARDAGFTQPVDDEYEWHPKDNLYYCETDEEWYLNTDDLTLVDDNWYLSDDDDIVYSEDEDEYLLKKDATEIDDLGWISDHRINS